MGIVVGLISDTHGLVRPGVFTALDGVELILHAGDVGEGVLEELAAIAPVHAVRGNTDPVGFPGLEESLEMELEGMRIHVSHGHELGSPTPDKLLAAYSADVIIYGHTHKQLVLNAGGRWIVNPGAAGAQRFKLSPSVGRLSLDARKVDVELVELSS